MYNCVGHFPRLGFLFVKYMFLKSEPGKAGLYLVKVALDLVKARRENGYSGKVHILLRAENMVHTLDKIFCPDKLRLICRRMNISVHAVKVTIGSM